MRTPKAIMDAAKGEQCTLRIPLYCNNNPETTVFCEHPDGTGGSNKLSGPLAGGFGCSGCHDAIDGRIKTTYEFRKDKEFYMRRSMIRTTNRLIELGLVTVKGL